MSRSTQAGFSFIEILVALAIVGILAAAAVPVYNIALARSRQAEAKTNLLEIAAAQRVFYAEQNRYGSLTDIRWEASGMPRYTYCLSPTDCYVPPGGISFGGGDDTDSKTDGVGILSLPEGGGMPEPIGDDDDDDGAAMGNPHFDSDSFEADAYGIIVDGYADYWMISQDEVLVNYSVGY